MKPLVPRHCNLPMLHVKTLTAVNRRTKVTSRVYECLECRVLEAVPVQYEEASVADVFREAIK